MMWQGKIRKKFNKSISIWKRWVVVKDTNLPPLLWDSIINFKRQTAQESHDGNVAKQIANVIYNGQTNPQNDPDIKKKTSYIMTMSNAHK